MMFKYIMTKRKIKKLFNKVKVPEMEKYKKSTEGIKNLRYIIPITLSGIVVLYSVVLFSNYIMVRLPNDGLQNIGSNQATPKTTAGITDSNIKETGPFVTNAASLNTASHNIQGTVNKGGNKTASANTPIPKTENPNEGNTNTGNNKTETPNTPTVDLPPDFDFPCKPNSDSPDGNNWEKIIFNSIGELNKMTQMLDSDDKIFNKYLEENNYKMNGLKTREDVINFLETINNMYLPVISETGLFEFNQLKFTIKSSVVNVKYEADNNWYVFNIPAKNNSPEEYISLYDKKDIKLIYEDVDNAVKIYEYIDAYDSKTSLYLMDVKGSYMQAHFLQRNEKISVREGYKLFYYLKNNLNIN